MKLKLRSDWREGKTPDEIREVEGWLAELDAVADLNPLSFFEPYPKQAEFLGSREPVKAFFGGNRAGKTEVGIVDDLIQAVDAECLPSGLRRFKRWDPPFYCRIISPDFTSTMEGVIFEKLRTLAPRDQLLGNGWDKAYDKQRRVLRFKNGSWFQFLTSEQDVDKHSGARLHRVHFDEEPPGEKGQQIWRENRMRLVDFAPESQAMFTMTPLFGLSWTFDEVWERREEPDTFCVVASIFDNPHIDPVEVEQAMRGMSREERQARVPAS